LVFLFPWGSAPLHPRLYACTRYAGFGRQEKMKTWINPSPLPTPSRATLAIKKLAFSMLGIVFLFGTAGSSAAQVKQVEMHIAGYLCGN
jgi:hypothetical protein